MVIQWFGVVWAGTSLSLLMRSWEPGVDAGFVLRDAWSLLRPLLHGLALVCVALAAKRMTPRA